MEYKKMEAAYRLVLSYLQREEDFIPSQIHYINHNRYMIVKDLHDKSILIMFKRNSFHEFGHKFIDKTSKVNGDSLNCDDLTTALGNGVTELYTVFPDGRIYFIEIIEFLRCSQNNQWTNREGKRIRSIALSDYKLLRRGE